MSSGDDTHHHRDDITHESNNSSEDAFVEYCASEAVSSVRVLIESNMQFIVE